MFGANNNASAGGFGAFGQNNNNQQQQQQQQQQPSGSGSSVFGGGGGFGQPASTGFGGNAGGGFGQTNATPSAFGSPANTGFGGNTGGAFGTPNAASPFGAAKPFGATAAPSTGGGLFGSNNTANANTGGGGFGGFGNNASTGFGTGTTPAATGSGLFGGSKPAFGGTASSAGTTGGLFGTAGAATGGAFGSNGTSTAIGFGAGNTQVPISGTTNPPFQAFTEKESTGNMTNHFQTIAFMPAYQKFSLEELRLQDYAQGRRYGNDSGTAGAFGTSTFGGGFGTNNQATGTGFGAANAAGGGGLFGNNNNNNPPPTPFGGTNNTGFGAANNAGAGGLFGTAKPATATGGLFGSNNTASTPFGGANTGGAFGGNAAATGGGLFGSAQKPAAATGGLFGSNNTGATGGLFGSNPPAGNSGFGTNQPGTGFGAAGNAGGGGLFGNAQPQQPATGAFGSPNTGGAFGGGGGGAFGAAQNNNQAATSAFGTGFGNNQQQQQNKPAFGTGFGAAQPTNTAGGLFGNTNNQPQNNAGLFGSAAKPAFGVGQTTTTAGGLFGNGNAPTTANTGGLFGNNQQTPNSGGGGLFGNPAGAQNTSGGGLFANSVNKPPASGLFAASQNPTQQNAGGLFGGSYGGNTQSNQPTGGGLFGNTQPQQQQGMGTSMFGGTFGGQSMQGMQQPQQPFQTSIADSPYGNSFIASINGQQNAPMGPIATPLSSSVQTKKAAMIPHYKIAPRQPSLTPRLGNSFSRSGSPFAASSGGNSSFGAGALGRSLSSKTQLQLFDNDDSLNPGAFTPNSSSRVASLKKLVIDKKIRDQDLFSGGADLRGSRDTQIENSFIGRGNTTKGILKKTVSFDIGSGRGTRDEDLYSSGSGSQTSSQTETFGPTPSAEELGFMRSTSDRRRARDLDGTTNGSVGSVQNDETGQVSDAVVIAEKPKEESAPGSYWMVPSAQRLSSLPREQLKRVTGFTVGRHGFGQVRFDHPVDLTGLPDFEKIPGNIVTFASRVCTVYPDTASKPPPGKGLNVPATITLEHCFPVSKAERAKIRDPEHPRYITHIRRLKGVKDTEFVDYLPNEGIWIFKVRHFTTYGLVESDDEDDDLDATLDSDLPAGETPTPRRNLMQSSAVFSDDEDTDVSGMDTSTGFDDTFDFKRHGSNNVAAKAIQDSFPGSFLGSDEVDVTFEEETDVDEDEADVTMDRSSFLREGSVETEEDEPAEPLSEIEEEDEPEEETMIRDEDDNMGPYENTLEDTPKTSTPAKDWTTQLNATISPRKRLGPLQIFSAIKRIDNSPLKNKNVIEPLSYGLLDLANDIYGDAVTNGNGKKDKGRAGSFDHFESPATSKYQTESSQLSKAKAPRAEDSNILDSSWRKAVRPCWGRDGTIFYTGEMENSESNGSKFEDNLRVAKLQYAIEDSFEKQILPKALGLQLKVTKINLDEFGVPVARLDPNVSFQIFTELSWTQDPAGQHEKSVWQLASVLWDPMNRLPPFEMENLGLMAYAGEKHRKERLSKFLEELIEKDADRHVLVANTLEEVAIAHLTAHRVEQACAALLEVGDYRLATLLPMIGGDEQFRTGIQTQLSEWRRKGVLAEVGIPTRALWELLSGNTCHSEGVKAPLEDFAEDFFISQTFGLDWRRAFGLKLWYGCSEEEGIASAVEKYEGEMKRYSASVPAPLPWYRDAKQPADDGILDILWGLLKLYADKNLALEGVLTPKAVVDSNINYRLSWQLRTILARRGIRDFGSEMWNHGELISGSLSDQITADFAGMLEQAGLWEWSVFVILDLSDADSRETAIRSLLGRHVEDLMDSDDGTKLAFLEKTLMVPRPWIFEARALQARHAGQHLQEAEYLLLAHSWNEAHKTIIHQVAPQAVISGELETLKTILGKFENIELVEKWATGGQVYLDYINLLELMSSSSPGAVNVARKTGFEHRRQQLKINSPKDVARRLLVSLKNVEKRGFLQGVAVREMAAVVGSWVLKNDMKKDAAKVLELPLSEDQFLKKTLNLSLEYYKARLLEIR